MLEIGAQRCKLELEVRHCIIELNVLDHEGRHLPREPLYPCEELVWVVDGARDLLQDLDQVYYIGPVEITDLTACKGKDPLYRITHDSLRQSRGALWHRFRYE